MKFERSAGILLHPTSLPSKYGIGELGKEAYDFIDFLVNAGQTLWQVFPLGPTGYGDSPYQCFSAFAGNPLLISIDELIKEGLLDKNEIENYEDSDPSQVDFGKVINFKTEILKKAFENYKKANIDEKDYKSFQKTNKAWLDDYALFMAAKEFHGGVVWTDWSHDIAFREEGAVKAWKKKLSDDVEYQKFLQYQFSKQWSKVKNYANKNNIKIIGDLPIFIAYDSSDLWANKELFTVNKKGKLETVAGVPPDYFSATGQLWGNPLYRWDKMRKNGFSWWTKRMKKMFELVDIVRIDHFRGFDAFWEIPGDAETAINGRWVKAPGKQLFKTIMKNLGDVPIIAEDLGVITKDVEALRDYFNFPGMKILQFAFGKNGDKKFLPHNHIPNCVVYTGSHDNDTTKGFFDKAKTDDPELYHWTQKYLDYSGDDMVNQMIRAAYASVANIIVIPMQDILNLGGEARMNFPGKLGGNWNWRLQNGQATNELAKKYKELTVLFERPKVSVDIEEIEVEN